MKLIIRESGDSSVGLQERYYYIDCPFEKDEVQPEDLTEFKHNMVNNYNDYAEMNLTAFYDFEDI